MYLGFSLIHAVVSTFETEFSLICIDSNQHSSPFINGVKRSRLELKYRWVKLYKLLDTNRSNTCRPSLYSFPRARTNSLFSVEKQRIIFCHHQIDCRCSMAACTILPPSGQTPAPNIRSWCTKCVIPRFGWIFLKRPCIVLIMYNTLKCYFPY